MDNKMSYYFSKWWIREPFFFVFILLTYTVDALSDPDIEKYIFSIVVLIILLYAHAMFNRLYLLPIWLEKNEFGRYFLWSILVITVFSLLVKPIDFYLLKSIRDLEGFIAPTFLNYFVSAVQSVLVVSSISFFSKMYENQKRQNEAQTLINQLEINQLRAQLNPHFLFNTLNNLYGVSLEEPHRIPDLLLQFSELTRYSVESTKRNFVPLHEELFFIKSYVALENERVSHRCDVRFSENIDHNFAQNAQIAPMLLMPLIENAFKHGTATVEKCFIDIQINSFEGEELQIVVLNSIPKTKSTKIASTSTGIENIQKRLEKLYPTRFSFETSQNKDVFHAEMRLKLT
jgi:two-component system, LytTR family, sensor kinase